MEIEQLVRQLQQKVDELNQVVLQLRQQQQQQQEDGRATRGSVDQLVRDSADTNWAAACSIDREERQKFYSVRLLRSRNAGALPCEATPAGVEAFLQCEVGSVQHVERMRDNALGKQRYIVWFSTAEAATAAYAGFRDSSNAAQALLVQKKTRLQNALVDLAIQLQQLGRGQCGYGEKLVVQVRGKAIVVKLGEGELVPYPFRQHLPSGRIPSPGEPFLHLNAGRLGQQLKQLLKPPSPSPAAAAAAAARPASSRGPSGGFFGGDSQAHAPRSIASTRGSRSAGCSPRAGLCISQCARAAATPAAASTVLPRQAARAQAAAWRRW